MPTRYPNGFVTDVSWIDRWGFSLPEWLDAARYFVKLVAEDTTVLQVVALVALVVAVAVYVRRSTRS